MGSRSLGHIDHSLTETLPLFEDTPLRTKSAPERVHADHKGSIDTPAAGAGGERSRQKKKTSAFSVAAHVLATRQREISISEFFTKNRHLLGFDNPSRALLATVKEAVDNSLDACEEARILPELTVELIEKSENRYRVIVEDNGPGIVKTQVPKIFGKLLYGSKFHVLKQTRGQQGIGISAAGMYGLLTTGKPITIVSRTHPRAEAHYYELQIDTEKNHPIVLKESKTQWNGPGTGTRVEIELEGRYQRGRHSVDFYLQQTALANPHVQIHYRAPKSDLITFPRVVDELPLEPLEIKPHPYGVELGLLHAMLKSAKGQSIGRFLQGAFSRVSPRVAAQILDRAGIKPTAKCHLLDLSCVERLYTAISQTRILAPPTNCLSPIGEALIEKSLRQQLPAEFYVARTRPPVVYRGNPFLVEVGLAYGGELSSDNLVSLYRFANRVPLLFQQSACAMTQAVMSIDWRNYGLTHNRGSLPAGPLVILIHLASVWVPYTSESKEAIADYDEILHEIRLALQECGRHLARYVRKRRQEAEAERKRSYIEKYIPHIGTALQEIIGMPDQRRLLIEDHLKQMLERSRS